MYIFWVLIQKKEGDIMARPTKSITTRTGHMSKNEIDARLEYEAKLRGESDRIRSPSFLSKEQKKLFKGIVDYLMPSGILGNIDVHVLTHTAITIDRINECERKLNKDGLLDEEGKPSAYLKMKSNYMKEFFRLCNELSLSPQSRAKLANINVGVEKEKQDPLLRIIQGGGG